MVGDDGSEARRQVAEMVLENKSCLVAEFFKRNPSADPRKVVLVTKSTGDGKVLFYIDYLSSQFSEADKVRIPISEGKRNENRKRNQAKGGDGERKGVGFRTRDVPQVQPVADGGGEGRRTVEVVDKRGTRNRQRKKGKGNVARLR